MPRQMRVFLVRHGESQANLDKALNKTLPDHRIPLSEEGHRQAEEAGQFLRQRLLGNPDIAAEIDRARRESRAPGIRLWRSPYLRTRQTSDGLLRGLGGLHANGGFIRDVREKPQLREQEYGLFDGVPDEDLPRLFPREHEHYRKSEDAGGRFWARMPMGESRCDVAERVHAIFGTFHRDADRHGIDTIIVVSHGVTIRAFVYSWMGYDWEWFEDQPNPGNCSIWLLDNGADRGLIHAGWRVRTSPQDRREDGVIAAGPSAA